MSTPTVSVECEVPANQDIVDFVHGPRLPGPVDVVGYDAEGNRVGVIVNPITDNEVQVIDVSGTAVRLVATPAAEEPEDEVLIDPDPRARQVPGIGRVVEPPITGP